VTARSLTLALPLLAGLSCPGEAGEAGVRYAAWNGCLSRSFASQAALTGRAIAADAALRDCREAEDAYLAALSTSPLLDGDDIARVRPALLTRARASLIARPRRLGL